MIKNVYEGLNAGKCIYGLKCSLRSIFIQRVFLQNVTAGQTSKLCEFISTPTPVSFLVELDNYKRKYNLSKHLQLLQFQLLYQYVRGGPLAADMLHIMRETCKYRSSSQTLKFHIKKYIEDLFQCFGKGRVR